MKSTTPYKLQLDRNSIIEEFSFVMNNNVLRSPKKQAEKFTRTYEEHSPALLRFCVSKLSNKEKAVDLVSDTFVRTWQYLQQGNSIENEKSFIYTIARNLIIDEYRKKKNLSLDALISSGFDVSTDGRKDIYTHIDNAFLIQEVSKLPAPYNSIIIMRYVNDFSVGHISLLTGNSENNVSVKIHRGLIKLQEILVHRYGYALL